MSLEYKFEPLEGSFPRDLTPSHQRNGSPFGKTWTEVQNLLEKELRFLNYRVGSVVLQTAHSGYDVRKDGKLRSDVRRPEHPGVVLKFEVYNSKNKRYDRMSFECDQFTEWKANVRAIADALEALRKVNRYGVSGGGHIDAHYEGYKALPSADGKTDSSAQAAAMVIQALSGDDWTSIISEKTAFESAYRLAVFKAHPDKGGSHESFIKLQDAKKILEKTFK